jgi:Ino eighty subunit 1
MKTALRTYHHIPSLQKTGGNVQDAPRIKAALKGAYTPAELKETRANTPARIEEFWASRLSSRVNVII